MGGGTTSGHGIFSQYRPEHMKQWILGESKHRDQQGLAQKSLKELRELTKCGGDKGGESGSGSGGAGGRHSATDSYKRIPDSDFLASSSGPLDISNQRDDDLWGEATWGSGVGESKFSSATRTSKEDGEESGQQAGGTSAKPGFLSLPPHLVHHHHFGWQHSQNDQERIVGTLSNRESYRKYGDAMSYCQLINTKHSLISTRKS